MRQALRYVPQKVRFEDCRVVSELDAALAGQDPALIHQAHSYEAFVLANRYPIYINVNTPLVQSAVAAYKQDPMSNSVYIYLLAAVLAHERVHAGEPSATKHRTETNSLAQACPGCEGSAGFVASSRFVQSSPAPIASAGNGSPDEWKAYQAELMLLRHFRNLGYIGGNDIDRYISHVEEIASQYRKQN